MTSSTSSSSQQIIFVGCLGVGVLGFLGLLATCRHLDSEHYESIFPSTIGIERTITKNSTIGLREGCEFALFEITEESAREISERGRAFLRERGTPRGQRRNPFTGWEVITETSPDLASRDANVLALGASGGCSNAKFDDDFDVDRALAKPGTFYNMTENREGLIVVDPTARRVAYMYFG